MVYLKAGEGKVISQGIEKIAVYREKNGNGAYSFSAKCPHRGCTVAWNENEKTFDCPCHGSRFSTKGEVIQGPAKKNLARQS